jgi:hypothetical protein
MRLCIQEEHGLLTRPSGTLSLDGLGLAPEQVGVRAGAVSGAAAPLTA